MNTAALLTHPEKGARGLAAGAEAFAPWFHNLHLPDGTQTAPNHPLGDFPAFKWRDIAPALPADLTGWTALDIGCNAGFYALELARRGAQVVAFDKDEHFLRQARWAFAQFEFGDRIELRRAEVYDLAAWDETFDLVLFLGVFYHLRYPLLGLDLVAERVRRRLVFQTLTMPGEEVAPIPDDQDFNDRAPLAAPGWPRMAFIEKKLAGDLTNWWAPNHAAVEAMLRSTGLRVVSRPGHEIYVCEPLSASGAAAARAWDQGERRAATGGGRLAAHGGKDPPTA